MYPVGRLCPRQESNSTSSVPQLARLFRVAHNPAQSGFDSCTQILKTSTSWFLISVSPAGIEPAITA